MISTYEIHNGDILEWAKAYLERPEDDRIPFHFIFGDWPYNLESIRKRYGREDSAQNQYGSDGAFQRQSAGFMGQTWDTGIAYDPNTWLALKPLLLPGGFTASFSHARTQHRLAMAQEDAGYLIEPAFYDYNSGASVSLPAQLAWIYSTGKPNGSNLSKLIDSRAGAKGPVIGSKKLWGHNAGPGAGSFYANGYEPGEGTTTEDIRGAATDMAKIWDGHQYGAPMKPEVEPIIIAQNPWGDDRLDSIMASGAGAYNISNGKKWKINDRFPGTLPITHHPSCIQRGYKEVKSMSGDISPSLNTPRTNNVYGKMNHSGYTHPKDENGNELVPNYECHPDCHVPMMEAQAGGEKAHFFTQLDWSWEIVERLAHTNPVFYAGKVTPKERNAGCTNLPLKTRQRANKGGYSNTPAWADTLQRNDHPTLKSIKLCQWIAGLFLPPPEYAPRRCLVVCSGTGSEVAGALLAGWDEVVAVEKHRPYYQISLNRVEFFHQFVRNGVTDVDQILASIVGDSGTEEDEGAYQPTLF